MKRITYILLMSFFVFAYNVNAQEDKTTYNDQDTFTYKKINILDKEKGNISFSGNNVKQDSNMESSVFENRSSNSGIGETLGNLSVSLTGGANYDIPIAAPQGIDGIEPEISITYNSQNGNGLAGYGWNVSGVSVISRIPSSEFHDGQIDGIDFDNLDRFALDGERLILKSGTYGANGSQYETEKFSSLKITSHGVSPYGVSYGPSYFTVYYPDGSKAQYGNSSDSRSHTNYAITYWENPQGVRISYEYYKNYNSQSISKIKYGSINSTSSINEIRFTYGVTRKRFEETYINGVYIVRKFLLSKIESYSNGVLYRKYSLGYGNNNQNKTNLEYDRLSAVQEISKDGYTSHSYIAFDYSTSNSSVNYNGITTDLGLENIHQENTEVVSLDMTGNGKMDFIAYPKNGKNKFWMFYDIQNGSFNYPYEVTTGVFETIFPSTLLNNQNKVLSGQGLTIVQKGSGSQIKFKVYSKASVASGLPIGYDYTKTWNSPTYTYQNSPTSSTQKQISKEYVSGDFNGDGLTDVLAIGKPYTNRYCTSYPCRVSGKEDSWLPITQQDDENDEDFRLREKSHEEEFKENQSNLRPPPLLDDDGPGGGGGGTCYSCTSYNVNYKSVYFINLRRDVPSNFANPAGSLQLQLSGDYKLQTGDFNGDGKTDLLHITNGKLYIYTLNNNNVLSLLWEVTDTGINVDDSLILGDFNGDGKTDFLDPTANNSYSFRTFISTGSSFVVGTKTQPFKYVKTNWNGNNGVLSGYNLVPLDVNGDGKTDIVEYNTITYNQEPIYDIFGNLVYSPPDGTQTIKIYNNYGQQVAYTTSATQTRFVHGGTAIKTGNLEHFPIPIFLTSNQPNKNLDFASISNSWVTNFSFTQDHREDVLLRSIANNGVKYDIEYSNIDPSIYQNDYYTQVYHPLYNQVYPNIDLEIAPGTKVVTSLERMSTNSPYVITPTKKIYAYQGAVFNAEGLGFLGFQGIARSNWHTGNSDRIFSVSKYNPNLRGTLIESYSTANSFSFTTPTSNYISKTTYQHSSSLSSSKVFKMWTQSSLNQNNLEGTYTNTTYQYDSYNNPISISSTYMGGSRTQSITYSNSTGSNYYIGRVTNTATSTTVESETFNTEQQFVYTGYLLTQRKIKGNGTPFDIETYNYDTFGNIIKKTITPNGESPREIEFEYDTSGRFLVKSIDIEDLETTYQYNTTFGNLTKATNPFNQETTYEYDVWDRQIKVIDYLGKETSTSFTESNYAYTITEASDDGSETIVDYNSSLQVSKVKYKNVFGEWISKKYEYDALDRLIKESESYTGSSPSQWNEVAYDLYSRPVSQTLHTGRIINISYSGLSTTVDDGVKVVTSTRSQSGNTTSVTDPGGTINYNYYGNGNLKTANYNGVIVSTEQDGWGRKTKLIDPSAGTFEYGYNGFGELTNETTPKGTTDYVYSSLGKLLEKNITGDNTDMSIQYSYNPTHKFLSAISVTNSDGNNGSYNYVYDSYIRLTNITESNPHAQFTKQYTYDGFGRIDTEEYYGKLLSNNKSSTKKIKNSYQNGVLKTIKDYSTNNNVWDATSVNARGQITSASVGNNITDSKSYDTFGYLTSINIEKNAGSTPEVLMQLDTDFNVLRGTLNSRSNSMFSWSETFQYDNLDRLINFNDNDGDNNLTYDDLGRITFNNTVGDYNYSGTSYQVANIDLNNQGDLYYQQNSLEQIKYNAFKKPFEINEEGKEKVGFQYNAFMGRSHMFYGGTEDDIYLRNNRKHYSFDGSMEISYDADSDTSLFVTYIGGDGYTAPAIWRSEQSSSTNEDFYYLHRDYLGSILLITDGDGNAQEKRHFDAWGKIVKLTDGNDNALDKLTFLDRGYTGHEHLQAVNLIHMNGRLYDPSLKRFLSPDNNIQDISNTQNFNRYGYVLNNPLMYVDPSGETYNGWEDETPGGLSTGQQVGIGGFVASAFHALEGLSFRGARNWIGRNFQSAIRDIVRPFREIGRFFRRLFGGGKKHAPVEYGNYGNLSSDPLAGSSMNAPPEFYGAGGNNGDLGISQSSSKAWLNKQLHRLDMYNLGVAHGFAGGIGSSVDFIKGLGTAQGWKDLGQGIENLQHLAIFTPEGIAMYGQMGNSMSNYIQKIPSMSAYEVGYDVGYGGEKIVEGIVLTRGASLAVNGVKYGANLRLMRSYNYAGGNIKFQIGVRNIKSNYHFRFERHKIGGRFNTHINYGIGGRYHFPRLK